MDKADFVALYLASLWEQMSDKPYAKEFAAALGTTPAKLMQGIPAPGLLSERYAQLAKRIRKSAPSGSWSTKDPKAFITAVSWNINEKDSWRSYMAQRVSMDDGAKPEGGGFTGILLDSSQWWQQPQLIPTNITPPYEWNPGLSGEMLADQLMVVGKWMAEAREQGDGVALFAHHPIKEFTPKTRRALQYLWENNQVILLVSGHTHAGYIDIHKGIAPTALEINVASITDWPMEWRELSLTRYTRDGQDYFGVRSPRHTVLQELVKQGFDLRENWQSFEDGAEKLLDYRVTSDLAMDYDTGVGDLLTGGQWFKLSTLGTLSWLVMGQDTLVKALYNNVLPNVRGMELEHLARLRLCIGQMIDIWDKFPTTGHVTMENWETEETHLRELAKTAMKDKSTRAEVDAAQWPMVRFELGRQMADPEAMRMHRVLLCVWASMYEANKTAEPEVRDESFRMDRVAPTKKR